MQEGIPGYYPQEKTAVGYIQYHEIDTDELTTKAACALYTPSVSWNLTYILAAPLWSSDELKSKDSIWHEHGVVLSLL